MYMLSKFTIQRRKHKIVYTPHVGEGVQDILPEFAIVGSRPRVAGIDIAALKFSKLSSVLKVATCHNREAVMVYFSNL
jgi:hypothetical protein